MATTCPHGLPAPDCLICRTLAPSAPAGAGGRVPAPAGGGRGGLVTHVAAVVAVIAAIAVVVWLVSGVVSALLHVAEFIVVAAVAGWVGYRIGRFRGRRTP